jgi:hypothetical protein
VTAVREAIFAEIEKRLIDITGVEEVERMPNQDPVLFNALHIWDGGHQPIESECGGQRYRLSVTIEGYHEQAGGAAAHAELNNLYSDAVSALLTDPPLGGLAETIDEGEYRPPQIAPLTSKARLTFSFDLDIEFSTVRGRPDQAA